jgi:hypothetical protein
VTVQAGGDSGDLRLRCLDQYFESIPYESTLPQAIPMPYVQDAGKGVLNNVLISALPSKIITLRRSFPGPQFP